MRRRVHTLQPWDLWGMEMAQGTNKKDNKQKLPKQALLEQIAYNG